MKTLHNPTKMGEASPSPLNGERAGVRGEVVRLAFRLFSGCLLLIAAAPQPLLACSACFGKSDSDLAKGMNMGIFALLGVVAIVLGGIASFFVYLGRRAGAQAASAQNLSDQSADKTAQ